MISRTKWSRTEKRTYDPDSIGELLRYISWIFPDIRPFLYPVSWFHSPDIRLEKLLLFSRISGHIGYPAKSVSGATLIFLGVSFYVHAIKQTQNWKSIWPYLKWNISFAFIWSVFGYFKAKIRAPFLALEKCQRAKPRNTEYKLFPIGQIA